VVCKAPVASINVTPAALYDKFGHITNWTYYKNGPHPGTPFFFDGSNSSFMADSACHPVWSWDLGDTTTATTSTVSHTYHLGAPATMHVKLTVKNDAGTDSTTVDLPLVSD